MRASHSSSNKDNRVNKVNGVIREIAIVVGMRPSIYSYLVSRSSKGDKKCCFGL
jgi:hypothetical protein